ncbi:MAG: hypothetical protein ABEI13_03610, partial [Candidatus Paceibacteria bacterium]
GIGLIVLIVLLVNRSNEESRPVTDDEFYQTVEEGEFGDSSNERRGTDSSQSEKTSSPSELASDVAATVRYQNGEFTPQTVTVQSGDTVKFINQGDGEMWVGSDEHPTHTQYDGTTLSEHCQDGDATSRVFDQCSTGRTYTFTFEKSGEWDYHNHVNASAGGTVIVE